MKINKRIDLKRSLLLIALALGFTRGLSAQDSSIEAAASAYHVEAIKLTSSSPRVTKTFQVDAMEGLTFGLVANSNQLAVSLIAPDGTRYQVGQALPANAQSAVMPVPEDPSGLAMNYVLTIQNPIAGTWSMEVLQDPAPTSNVGGMATFHFDSPIVSTLVGGGKVLVLGNTINLGVVTLDQGSTLKGLRIGAKVKRADDANDPESELSFLDDGSGADGNLNDGIFSASYTPTSEGRYVVQVRVEGTAPGGAFQRSLSTGFKVVRKKIQVLGTFTERAVVGPPR